MKKPPFDLEYIAEKINDVIADQLIGKTIMGFKLDPIKGKKTSMLLTIRTNANRYPPVTRIEDLFSSANLLFLFNYNIYDVSTIRLEVKLHGDWR